MKTIRLLATLAFALAAPALTQAQTGYTEQDVDECFYAVGVSQSDGLEKYLKDAKNVDMQYNAQFVKGVRAALEGEKDDAQKAYQKGTTFIDGLESEVERQMKDIFGERQLVATLKQRFVQKAVNGVADRISRTAKYSEEAAGMLFLDKKEKLQSLLSSGQTPGTNMQQDAEEMFYALGISMSGGLDAFLKEHFGVSDGNRLQFVRGLKDACQATTSPSMRAYYAGIEIGQMLFDQTVKNMESHLFGEPSDSLSRERHQKQLANGFIAGVQHTARYSREQAQKVADEKREFIEQSILTANYGDYKTECERFLETNKQKPGITVLPSGVQYKIITPGTGTQKPRSTSKVKVHYEGKLIDGTVFDSSYERGEPAVFGVNQAIPGWSEILQQMPEGSVWEVYIPQEQGYGNREIGKSKPFSTLIFKIYLISIEEY